MLVSITILNACGSGGGSDTTAGIGGTGIAVGKITGFGSVYVNGDRFTTDNSTFINRLTQSPRLLRKDK